MISIPLDPVYVWLMVFLRTALLLTFFPLFGEGFVPVKIRIVLAAATSFMLTPVVPLSADAFPSTLDGFVQLVASEALLGLSLGFVGRALFAVVQFSGQLAGEQMGFGIVNAINPTSGHQVSVVAEMQYLLSVLVFLAAGLHHLFLAVLANSFAILEPGAAIFSADLASFFMQLGRTVFTLTVQFAMPVIVVVFAINIAMAMVGRAVPQINVFLESFPLRIIGGLLVTIASLDFLVRLWLQMFRGMDSLFTDLLGILGGA